MKLFCEWVLQPKVRRRGRNHHPWLEDYRAMWGPAELQVAQGWPGKISGEWFFTHPGLSGNVGARSAEEAQRLCEFSYLNWLNHAWKSVREATE